jgi:hypothetical protein
MSAFLMQKWYELTGIKPKAELVLIALLIWLVASISIVFAFQNATEVNVTIEEVNLCANVTCTNLTTICPDGFVASCTQTCDPATGECVPCTPDCTGHEEVCNITCEACQELDPVNCTCNAITPCCGNDVCESTEMLNENNECVTDCGLDCDGDGIKESWTCQIQNVTNETATETVEQTPVYEPSLIVEIIHPTKTTRGGTVEIKAIVRNVGLADANNVLISWELSTGFAIISGNQIENCGTISPNDSCTSVITAQTSISTMLGKNEIKVVVSYE